MHGDIAFGTDTGKLNFWGIMSLGINNSEGAPYGVINAEGIGLQLPSTIIGNGLNFYKNAGEAMGGQSFASINSSGITSIGSLIIENINGGIAWEFKNGTIRNWNAYCDSEIKTNNVLDGGNGYSTINLIAKKYSAGELDDSISLELNGSTKTVTVSDNATVQLPANTTIGGVAPAVFGSTVDGALKSLIVGDRNSGTLIDETYISIYSGALILDQESVESTGIPCGKISSGAVGIIIGNPIHKSLEITNYEFEQNTGYTLTTGVKDDSYPTGYIDFNGPKFEMPGGYIYDVEFGTHIENSTGVYIGGNNATLRFGYGGYDGLWAEAQYGVTITHQYGESSELADKPFKALELTNKNGAGLTVTLSGGYNGRPDTVIAPLASNGLFMIKNAVLEGCSIFSDTNTITLGSLKYVGTKILGQYSENTNDVFVDINDADNPSTSEITLNAYGNSIRIANTNAELGAMAGYEIKMTAPKVSISDTFEVPVYTENTDGSYTKTNKSVSLRVVERDGAYTIVID